MELEGNKELLLYIWLISIKYINNVVLDIRSKPLSKVGESVKLITTIHV